MNIGCNPFAVTLLPSTFTGAEGRNAMLVHFKVLDVPNKGKPFWIELGKLGFIRLSLKVIIGDRATYEVETWRPEGAALPPEEPMLSAFLDLPQGDSPLWLGCDRTKGGAE